MNQDNDWSDGTPSSELYTDASLNYEAGDVAYAGSYTVKLKNMTQKDVRIESEGTVNNSKRKISVRVTR